MKLSGWIRLQCDFESAAEEARDLSLGCGSAAATSTIEEGGAKAQGLKSGSSDLICEPRGGSPGVEPVTLQPGQQLIASKTPRRLVTDRLIEIAAIDRAGREGLLRYCARPPFVLASRMPSEVLQKSSSTITTRSPSATNSRGIDVCPRQTDNSNIRRGTQD